MVTILPPFPAVCFPFFSLVGLRQTLFMASDICPVMLVLFPYPPVCSPLNDLGHFRHLPPVLCDGLVYWAISQSAFAIAVVGSRCFHPGVVTIVAVHHSPSPLTPSLSFHLATVLATEIVPTSSFSLAGCCFHSVTSARLWVALCPCFCCVCFHL